MIEASLKVNTLGQNVTYTNSTARIRQIYNLLLMKPGTDPLNPSKGCDVRSYYYQIKDDTILQLLQTKISEQIAKYTPYTIRNVLCKAIKNRQGNYILHIAISLTNSSTVVVSTDGEQSTLNLIDK